MLKSYLLSGCCAIILASVTPALAAETAAAASDSDLETVVVNAYHTQDKVESSTKTDTPLIETPQAVSVVTRAEMDARGVTNLNEALRYDAGVLSESQGIDNRVDDFYIRGFDAGSWGDNVTLDGMRSPHASQWNRSSYDSWYLEEVDVLKGPSAVLYGQVAPGGMVNQVSKKPHAQQEQQARIGINNFGSYNVGIDLGTSFYDDTIETRLVADYRNGDTQLDHVQQQHWMAAPSVKFNYDSNTDLTLQGFVQRDQGGSTFQFLPYEGTMTKGAEGYIKNTTFLGEPHWNVFNRTIWNAGWQFRHAFNENWTFRQNGRFDHTDSLYRATVSGNSTLTDDRVLPRRAVQGRGHSTGYNLDTRIVGHVNVSGVKNTVLVGSDWKKDDWHGLRQAAKVNSSVIAIDVYDPVYTNYDIKSALVNQISQDGDNKQLGFYLQDQISVGKWRITLSGRHDHFRDRTYDRLDEEWENISNSAFTKRAGILYHSDTGLAPYFSYAESFQPSSHTPGDSYDGKAFDPTEGKQFEAGLKYQPKNINGMITVSAYELYQKNVATADPDESHDCGSGEGSCYVVTGEVRVRGIEAEGRLTPFTGLSLIGSLTHMDSEITKANDTTKGNDMKRVPQWSGNAWVDYTFMDGLLRGLSLAGGTRYVDTTYGNTANSLKIDGYTLWDAALRYDLTRFVPESIGLSRTQFSVNANNIADKRYVSTCTAATACFYGSGRTINFTLSMGW